jgi:hypothetical protein
MDMVASTFAPRSPAGGSSSTLSTLPMRTPARRTSEPERRPSPLANCARSLSFFEKGDMSPDALRIRKIRTPMAPTTKRPTRKSRSLADFLIPGIIFFNDEG